MPRRNHKKKLVVTARRSQPIQSYLLIVCLQAVGLIGLSILGATAQPSLNSLKQTPAAQSKKPTVPTQAPSRQKSILESLLSLLQRKSFLGGSRNSAGFCGISPAVMGQSNIIWSDRPLFLWQGEVQSLELRPYAFDVAYEQQPLLWSFSPIRQQAIYPNQPLQAGQRYEWQAIYLSQINKFTEWQRTFQVMEKTGRDRVAQDLTSLENQLKLQGATVEEAALARANYFANQDLWSDALQQIYAVGHPFSAGHPFLQAATERICNAKPSNLVDSGKNPEHTN